MMFGGTGGGIWGNRRRTELLVCPELGPGEIIREIRILQGDHINLREGIGDRGRGDKSQPSQNGGRRRSR